MQPARRRIAIALVLGSTFLAMQSPARTAPDRAVVGEWTLPFSEDGDGDGLGDFAARAPASREESAMLPTAVNAAVLPDGQVLYWSQLDGSESVDYSIAFQQPTAPRSRTRVLDLAAPLASGSPPPPAAWSVPQPEDGGAGDMLGSDQRHLPDGRVLAIGGTRWSNEDAGRGLPEGFGRTELYGRRDARIFDPATKSWSQASSMTRPRYYPALVTLADGRLAAVGGAERLVYNSSLVPGPHPAGEVAPRNVTEVELYDPVSDAWTIDARPGARAVLPPLARLHLLPNGMLFYPGVGMLYPPGGGDVEAGDWNRQRWYDPATGRWEDAGIAQLGVRSNAFSALLRLAPPYDRASVLVGGGTIGQWPGGYVATPLTEVVTWDADSLDPSRPARALGGVMTSPRWHSSAVVLPTGEVVALSGADRDEVIDPGSGIAVRHAELYDPETGTWTKLASSARDRTLHNTAILLRDGSILVGGHSPVPAHYGTHASGPAPLASNFKDPSFEIFRPPYLFRGPRPVISSLSDDVRVAGQTLRIETPDASDPSLRVVLSRLPSVTHVTDPDQRTVELAFARSDGAVDAVVPHAAVVPPGHYYVFLTKDHGSGATPSIAEVLRVDVA